MKILLPFLAVLFLISCKEQTKTTVEKSTDTAVKDSVGHDTLKLSVPAPEVKSNDTIVAGKSIGRIYINEKSEDLVKDLGEPDSSDAGMGKAMLKWFSKPTMKNADTSAHSIIIYTTTNFGGKDEAARVKHIRITSPFFKTADAVGVGSSIAFIKMKYDGLKKPSASYTDKNGSKVMIYDAAKEGIAFEIDESTKCIGITVHKPGEKAWETYTAEFGDVDKEK